MPGPATHVEIEDKFDVDEGFVVGDLLTVAGVTRIDGPVDHHLDAEYFDTADLRLLRSGIGLRRRTGGSDSGWHLKIEQPSGARVEVQRPLGRSTSHVPKALRDLVTVHVRDHEVAPVARLQTHRRVHHIVGATGSVVVELADDTVRADTAAGVATQWREVEIEVVGDGGEAMLGALADHLTGLGATPSTARSKLSRAFGEQLENAAPHPVIDAEGSAGHVVRAYLRMQVSALAAADPMARVDAEDAVHKMRVAVRRLRSALATYRRLLDPDVTEPIRSELLWLGGVLGPIRDAEVIRAHLRAAVADQPPALVIGPVRRRIDTTLNRDHGQAHTKGMVELTSARYIALLDSLDHITDAVSGKRSRRPARKVLPTEVRRAHRRMRRLVDEAVAGGGPTDEQLHELRKAVKRVRYAAESVTEVFGADASELATRMEAAQELLGAHQDTVVIRTVVLRLAAEAADAGEPSFTYGRLHAAEQQRADDNAREFLAAVDDGWAKRPRWLR